MPDLSPGVPADFDPGVPVDPSPGVPADLDPGVAADPSPGVCVDLSPGLTREWRPGFPVDARLTLSVLSHGPGDPTFRADRTGAMWRTSLTPDGPGTLRITQRAGLVTGVAWGAGAGWLLDTMPALLGADDDPAEFHSVDATLTELAGRLPGLRIGRSQRLLESLVPAVLEQKVVSLEAHRAWRTLLYKFGTKAPGPGPSGLRVFPDAATWVRVPSWEWHLAGVEGVRAKTIMNAARAAGRLESLARDEADQVLRSLPGIGVWTSAEIRQRVFGDPDAISVGDYHLPKVVGWALAGQRDTDDAAMLELLVPYQGQRYRVQRLIELGHSGPPRRAPRMPVRDYRRL